jgi:hypothetical protein
MIEELQFEISRATRKAIVQTDYDAMSCYDRIIPNLAMLVSRKFGVSSETTHSNASTLEKAKYHIRTDMGVLKLATSMIKNGPFTEQVKEAEIRL